MRLHFTIAERGIPIPVTREHLTLYSGPSQIIATALMFRLFGRAIADLAPEGPPERTDIAVLTAFPGPGVMDCIEYVTRARTMDDGRFAVDLKAGPVEAPEALPGKHYYEVEICGKRRGYWPVDGYFDKTFLTMVSRYQAGHNSPEHEAAYQAYKHEFIGRLLGASEDSLFRFRDIA